MCVILFFFNLFIEITTESDGNDNYVHQTMRRDTTKTIIIIAGSLLGGISLLLLLAIMLLPLLTCHAFRSRRLKRQQ